MMLSFDEIIARWGDSTKGFLAYRFEALREFVQGADYNPKYDYETTERVLKETCVVLFEHTYPEVKKIHLEVAQALASDG